MITYCNTSKQPYKPCADSRTDIGRSFTVILVLADGLLVFANRSLIQLMEESVQPLGEVRGGPSSHSLLLMVMKVSRAVSLSVRT